jgi:hypothetical protein
LKSYDRDFRLCGQIRRYGDQFDPWPSWVLLPDNALMLDDQVAKMTLGELLPLDEGRMGQDAPKTIGNRQSVFKLFKQRWPHGLNISIHSVGTSQRESWPATKWWRQESV